MSEHAVITRRRSERRGPEILPVLDSLDAVPEAADWPAHDVGAPTQGSADVAPWHEARPLLLAGALHTARRAAPHLVRLADHTLPWAPRWPLASQTIRAITLDRHSDPAPLDEAITLPWMAWDTATARNVIAIDIDHADGPERSARLAAVYGLPRPALIIDPWSGRSHAVLRLVTPVITTEGARVGPKILFDLAGRLLAAALGGSLLTQCALIKSPWGRTENLVDQRLRRGPMPTIPALWEANQAAGTGLMWHTEPGDLRPIELREIVGALAEDYGEEVAQPGTRARFRNRRTEPDARGRNCTLFDLVRWWAYDHVERDGSLIRAEAERVNATFADPLPGAEIRATARSIARLMATRYRPRVDVGNRGRDRRSGATLDHRGRKQLAGRVTAAGRGAVTDLAIVTAVQSLRTAGKSLTQVNVAAAAGIAVRTVARRRNRTFPRSFGSSMS